MLLENFDGDPGKWIKGSDPSPLATFTKPYVTCQPCSKAIPKTAAHSSFESLVGKETKRLLDEPNIFWGIWKSVKSENVDIGDVPFPKEE